MSNHSFASLSFVAVAALLSPLAGAQTFQGYYSGGTNIGSDIVSSRDCGFVAVGMASTNTIQSFVMRLNPEGKVVWSKAFFNAPTLISRAESVAESPNSDLLVSGVTGVQSINSTRRFVMRLDGNGNLIWNVMLEGGPFTVPALFSGGIPGFVPVSLSEMRKGQIIGTGRTLNANGALRVGELSLLDANGSLLFSNRYVPAGGSTIGLDFLQAREARDANGEILVLGTLKVSTNLFAMFAMRTDVDGNIIWAKHYRCNDGVSSLGGSGFDLAANGDILYAANRAVLPVTFGTNPNCVVGRIDALTGDLIAQITVDNFGPGYQSVIATPDDGLIVSGLVGAGNDTTTAALRVDPALHNPKLWRYGTVQPNTRAIGEAITPTIPFNGYAIFGRNEEFSPTDSAFIVRTNQDMLSRCNEEELNVNSAPIEMKAFATAHQVVANTFYLPDPMLSDDPNLKFADQCIFPPCLGDLNGDGLVDDSDFVLFAGAYDILLCPTDPTYSCCPADFNNDGFVDDTDFVLFANAYDELICPS